MSHEELMHFDGEAPAIAPDDGAEAASDAPVDAQELVDSLLRWRDELTDMLEQLPTPMPLSG